MTPSRPLARCPSPALLRRYFRIHRSSFTFIEGAGSENHTDGCRRKCISQHKYNVWTEPCIKKNPHRIFFALPPTIAAKNPSKPVGQDQLYRLPFLPHSLYSRRNIIYHLDIITYYTIHHDSALFFCAISLPFVVLAGGKCQTRTIGRYPINTRSKSSLSRSA